MTYPPQDPQGWPSGQGGQPGYNPAQQFPAGYGAPGGPGGGPPKKNNKLMIFSVAGVVAVLLAAFLVTGLWVPGFLVGDDDEPEPVAAPSTSETEAPQPSAPSTQPPAQPTGESTLPPATTEVSTQPPVTTEPSTPGGQQMTSANAAKIADTFLAALRKGDAATADTQICKLSALKAKNLIKDKLKAKRSGKPDKSTKDSFWVPMSGTYRGEKLAKKSKIGIHADYEDDAPCVWSVQSR